MGRNLFRNITDARELKVVCLIKNVCSIYSALLSVTLLYNKEATFHWFNSLWEEWTVSVLVLGATERHHPWQGAASVGKLCKEELAEAEEVQSGEAGDKTGNVQGEEHNSPAVAHQLYDMSGIWVHARSWIDNECPGILAVTVTQCLFMLTAWKWGYQSPWRMGTDMAAHMFFCRNSTESPRGL